MHGMEIMSSCLMFFSLHYMEMLRKRKLLFHSSFSLSGTTQKNIQAPTISAHCDLSLHSSRGQASFIAMSLHLTFKPNYASPETASCPHLISLSHSYIVCSHKLSPHSIIVCAFHSTEFHGRNFSIDRVKTSAPLSWSERRLFFLGA